MRLCTLCLLIMLCATSRLSSQVSKKSRGPLKPADLEKEMQNQYLSYTKLKDDSNARKKINPFSDSFHFTPKYIYIQQTELFPELKDDSVGFTLQPKSGSTQLLTFEKGTTAFFNNYLEKSINKVDSLYPVVLKIKKINISETRVDAIYDDCKLDFEYVFECRYRNKTTSLTSYSGNARIRVLLGMRKAYDSLVQQTLQDVIPKIDEMMNEAIDKIPDLCKAVNHKIYFRDNVEGRDTIFYNGQSPLLSWNDYTGITSNENQFSSYGGIFFQPDADYKRGVLNISTTIGTCFIKNMSLAGDNARKEEILRHENYRLKLIHCYTLKLKKQLEGLQLTIDNYRDELNKTFATVNAEMKIALDAYSSETRFGLKKKEQQKWEASIQEKQADFSQ